MADPRHSLDMHASTLRIPSGSLAVLALLFCTACTEKFSAMVEMRDGVHLATDVYLPSGDGPWPTIVYRTPYGKTPDAAGQGLVTYGIAVVNQDMRGRYDSEGEDRVFTSDGDGELKDGYDTLEWAAEQSWCDGQIGTFGGSARGIVQYMQTSAAPPELVVIDAQVATPNLYSDALFQGGAFRRALAEGWLAGQDSQHFLENAVEHPYEDEFWASVQTHDQYGNVTVPGIHEGGWYDIFGQGNVDAFRGYQHEGAPGAAGQQKLVMGPWTHGLFTREEGELTYPENAEAPPYPDAFNTLFNHYLELDHPDIADHPDDVPTVQYYVMGDVDDSNAPGNEWRTAEDWPPDAAPVRFHLQSDGTLAQVCPAAAPSTSSYLYDPADPSPTVCGANLTIPAGPCDQRAVEERDDNLIFDTPELAEALEITGHVRAHLFVDIDQPDTDLIVRMTDVYPDGRSMLIADGAARLAARGTSTGIEHLQPDEVVEAVVDLWSTSIILAPGHRLRLAVTSSNDPRFAPNMNNGLVYPHHLEGTPLPVMVRIHHEVGYASYVELPDPTRDAEDFVACD